MSWAPRIKAEFRQDGSTNSTNDNIAATNSPGGEADSDVFEFQRRQDEEVQMGRMGLPNCLSGPAAGRFTMPNRAVGRKGEKQSFICKVCNIDDLNSLETKTKHENGKDHVYNVYKAWKRHQLNPGDKEDNQWLEVFEEVAPTRQVSKKTCYRLNEKLQQTGELVVGLQHVTEIIACSSEEEPYYRCHLCPSKGQANMMYNHLLGKEHRKNVLKKEKPHIVDDNPRVIQKELEEFRQTDWSMIESIYSDELYPWESGKAPWSVERGGTGETPTGAQRVDIMFDGIRASKAGPGSSQRDSKAGILPADMESFASGFSRIKVHDTRDLRKGYDLAMDIVRKLSERQASSPGDPGCLKLIADGVQTGLTTLKAMGHRDDKTEVPDQSRLWEMEQERRQIKKEKEDKGYDRYDSTSSKSRRVDYPGRGDSSDRSSGGRGGSGSSHRDGHVEMGRSTRDRDDRSRERSSGCGGGSSYDHHHHRDRSRERSSGRSSSSYGDRSPEAAMSVADSGRKRKSYY